MTKPHIQTYVHKAVLAPPSLTPTSGMNPALNETGIKPPFLHAVHPSGMTFSPPPEEENPQPAEQDTQAAALKAKKIAQLEAKIAAVQAQIEEVGRRKEEVSGQLKSPTAATSTVQTHIHLLHTYNQIRDIGTGLFGMIADSRGVRVKEIYGEFGLSVDD